MKWFFWILIFLAFFTPIIFIGKGIDHLDIMKERYKRALDAGVGSAARSLAYEDSESINQIAIGFGDKMQHSNHIPINKQEALNWFYRVFYRNLGLQNNFAKQEELKRYIPMKAIAGFDKLMIADLSDQWVIEQEYRINYRGTNYKFTLSNQVMNMDTGIWGRDLDFGIDPNAREALVSEFIRTQLDGFLESRENKESGILYRVNIAPYDYDYKTENIDGISFMVMAEGLPLPSLNPWKSEKYYAFALGGTEITRE